MSDVLAVGLLSFFGGALLTAFGYTILIINKLSTLTTRFDEHVKASGTCIFHTQITTDAAVAKTKAEELVRRLDSLNGAK